MIGELKLEKDDKLSSLIWQSKLSKKGDKKRMISTEQKKILLLVFGIIFLILNYILKLNISILPIVLIIVSIILLFKPNKVDDDNEK